MEVNIEKKDEITVAVLSGRIDSTTSKDLENKIVPLVDAGTKKLVLDFTNVDFISSAGLRILLLVTKKLKNAGGKIALCCLKGTIKEVFEISGFVSIIPIFATSDEALSSVK